MYICLTDSIVARRILNSHLIEWPINFCRCCLMLAINPVSNCLFDILWLA